MKLTIERLNDLTPDDCRDLAKIWPEQSPSSWQSWLDQGNALFAARFNERLLGAVKVKADVQTGIAVLHDLCVREVTRRRGVGLYLVEDTLRQVPQINAWQFSVAGLPPAQRDELGHFMLACGFTSKGDIWQK